MIVEIDSPLRRLPHALESRQTSILVGLRYAVQMLDLSYTELIDHDLPRLELSGTSDTDDVTEPWSHTAALLHAWSVVDSAHRLRLLLGLLQVPSHAGSPLMDSLDEFRLIRNDVQHLDERIERSVTRDDGQAVWGSLTWVHSYPNQSRGTVYVAMPGTVARQRGLPALNPVDRELTVPIDAVELHAYGHRARLSEVHNLVSHFVLEVLSPQLKTQFEGHETAAADLVVAVEFAV